MTITHRTHALSEKARTLTAARRTGQQYDEYAAACQIYEALAQHLEGIERVRASLAAQGIPTEPHYPSEQSAAEVATLAHAFREDREALLTDANRQAQSALRKRLDKLADLRKKRTEDDWAAWVNAQRPQVAAPVLQALGSIPALRSKVQGVQGQLQQFDVVAASLPQSEEAIEAVRQLAKDVSEAWRDLGAADLPEAVHRFLREVERGAPLQALTEEVRAWLAARDLGGEFQVTMRTRGSR